MSVTSAFQVATHPTDATKFDFLDDDSRGNNNEDNITFKVLGSATVSIGGAVIGCENKAEINIIRKKGGSRTPRSHRTISETSYERERARENRYSGTV
jgi:hypothetical protein